MWHGGLYKNNTLIDGIKLLHQEVASKYDASNDNEAKEKIIDLFIIIEADKLLS